MESSGQQNDGREGGGAQERCRNQRRTGILGHDPVAKAEQDAEEARRNGTENDRLATDQRGDGQGRHQSRCKQRVNDILQQRS